MDGRPCKTHSESLARLSELGFSVLPESAVLSGFDSIANKVEKLGGLREELSFDMDGAVIKVDNLADRITVGEATSTPKWAVAYKYPP